MVLPVPIDTQVRGIWSAVTPALAAEWPATPPQNRSPGMNGSALSLWAEGRGGDLPSARVPGRFAGAGNEREPYRHPSGGIADPLEYLGKNVDVYA